MSKKMIGIVTLLILVANLRAQVGDILKKSAAEGAKRGAEVSTEKTADKVVDKTLNKLFGGKKNKPQKNEKGNESSPETTTNSIPGAQTDPPLKTYTKYDFIPGETILGYDDFSQETTGDFPARWTTDASGEIVTVDNHEGKWLTVSKEGFYIPEFVKSLPENFTLEYDLLFIPPSKAQGPNTATFGCQFIHAPNKQKQFEYAPARSYFEIDPYMSNINIASYTSTGEKLISNQFTIKGIQRSSSFFYHVAVWRQKTRLRVYLNETKVIDAPSLLSQNFNYNMFRFSTSLNNDGSTWLISNFKIAGGLPDTRNKLITEGKISTTGILFGINKATIKPESYAILKEIASVMKENNGLRVKIIGHTDSDGDNNANITLSKQRAAAVKTILTNEFGIAENRMDTDGKGASQPVASNNTSEGKAQNRRVEFIKL